MDPILEGANGGKAVCHWIGTKVILKCAVDLGGVGGQ